MSITSAMLGHPFEGDGDEVVVEITNFASHLLLDPLLS
jgi:hypothetical protein